MSISLHFDLTILLSKGIYKNTQEQWTSELKMIQVYFYSKRRSLNRDIDFLAFIQYCTENGPDLAIPSGDMEAVITVMVPIDFSGITCISKGFQDVTQCPISSKTKCTWVSVPLRSAGCSFPSCPIFILWFYSCLFVLHIFFFCPTEPHHYVKSTSPPAFLSGFFHLSSNVILSSELMPALTDLSSFGSVVYDDKKILWASHYLSLYFLISGTKWERDITILCKVNTG